MNKLLPDAALIEAHPCGALAPAGLIALQQNFNAGIFISCRFPVFLRPL